MPCPTREHGSYGPAQGRYSKKTRESYEEVKNLGEGAQSKVCVVRRRSNKKFLIWKEQNVYSIFDDMPCEMHILKEVLTDHPRTIEFDSGSYLKANNALVLPRYTLTIYQGGGLINYVPRAGDKGVSKAFIKNCFIQLAEAFAFLLL